jgi:uncharacterized protein YndB with AHSA1/START domain
MNLLFDFTVDKDTKTMFITREFAADLDLVWDAFTKSEMLDRWHAPKPYKLFTKEMDFREGGRWLYTMVSPEASPGNASRYSMVEYLKINPKTDFSTKNTFADENGNSITNAFSLVKNTFKAGNEITTVYIEKRFEDLAVLEMMATNGFKEGTAAGFENLDEYLRSLVTSK